MDFRSWLISRAKEAYFAALKDPDSLADLDSGDGLWFESFAYAGYYALKKLTGEAAFDNTSEATGQKIEEALKVDIEYGEGIDYLYEWDELAERFPRLFAKAFSFPRYNRGVIFAKTAKNSSRGHPTAATGLFMRGFPLKLFSISVHLKSHLFRFLNRLPFAKVRP